MAAPAPWLTIVTVVKDDPVGLTRTRNSLARHDLAGVEWLVLDGSGNPDQARRILSDEKPPARYEWREPAGVYRAMNDALELSTGDYTWFVNAGDEVAEGATIPSLRSILSTHPLWLIGQVAFVDDDGTRTVPPPFDYVEERRHFFARGRFAPHQGTIAQTAAIRQVGGFNPDLRIAADYELSLHLALSADPMMTDQVIAVFHTGGLSSQKWGLSVREFHDVRRRVLRPSGLAAAHELGLTGMSWVRAALSAGLRRARGLT